VLRRNALKVLGAPISIDLDAPSWDLAVVGGDIENPAFF